MKIAFILIVIVSLLSWNCRSDKRSKKMNEANRVSEAMSVETKEAVDTLETVVASDDDSKEERADKHDHKKGHKKPHAVKTKLVDVQNVKSQPVSMETITNDFSVDYLMGKFNPKQHKDFTDIKSTHASRAGMRLRKDTYESFQKMYNAALKDGVRLTIISATRPFMHQKRIWEAKWFGKRKVNGRMLSPMVKDEEMRAKLILMYSSMPGTSRHHWGTDIDLNDLNNPYFEKGKGKKIYDWLVANAYEYGFCQVYSEIGPERPNGYLEEKWHWSYVPVARRLTEQYKAKVTNADITGFAGSNTVVTIDMVNNYVLGINAVCK